jgi:hypothetical protein
MRDTDGYGRCPVTGKGRDRAWEAQVATVAELGGGGAAEASL